MDRIRGVVMRGVLNEMRKLGVQSVRFLGAAETTAFGSWLELIPLHADKQPLERPEQQPVLFELSSGEDLTRLIFEVLRLGNDRQSYRWLEDDNDNARALLRVIGPPYYSLLRALDRMASRRLLSPTSNALRKFGSRWAGPIPFSISSSRPRANSCSYALAATLDPDRRRTVPRHLRRDGIRAARRGRVLARSTAGR